MQRGWRALCAAGVGAINQSSTPVPLRVSGGQSGLVTMPGSLSSLFFLIASLSPCVGWAHGTALAPVTVLVLILVHL